MNSISFDEMSKLSVGKLVERMDQLLQSVRSAKLKSYYIPEGDSEPYVRHFYETELFRDLPNASQRPAVWKAFDLILQMEYVKSYFGLINQLPLPQSANEPWKSPNDMVFFLALEQSSIVSARIVLERFMDMVHFYVTGSELAGSSKFSAFRNWLSSLSIESEWFYLLPYLPMLRRHDIDFRSAEVHDGSKLKKHFVTLQNLPSHLQNEAMDLINILSNIWRNVLPAFNRNRPTTICSFKTGVETEWISRYIDRDFAALEREKIKVLDALEQMEKGV